MGADLPGPLLDFQRIGDEVVALANAPTRQPNMARYEQVMKAA